jgi:hypothetical protein
MQIKQKYNDYTFTPQNIYYNDVHAEHWRANALNLLNTTDYLVHIFHCSYVYNIAE